MRIDEFIERKILIKIIQSMKTRMYMLFFVCLLLQIWKFLFVLLQLIACVYEKPIFAHKHEK